MPSYTSFFDQLAGKGGIGGIVSRSGVSPMPTARNTLQKGAAAGYFEPGAPASRAAFRGRLFRDAGSRQRRAQLRSSLYGLDPMQQRQQLLDEEQNALGDTFNQLGGFDLSQIQGEQDFYRQLLMQDEENRQREKDRKAAARAGVAGGVGQIAGKVVGHFLPGG